MTTTSRGLSQKQKHSRASSSPGKTKGGFCVRPKNCGLAINGNPYKGSGMKGSRGDAYIRLWDRYKSAKGNH